MLAACLGIAAALCWGFSDFLGGWQARRLTLATVVVCSQATGLAAIALVAAMGISGWPSGDALAAALVAGVCQLVGAAALYRGLAVGTMSIVSPVTAGGAAALPVLVGLLAGEELGTLQFFGIIAALAGIVLACRAPETEKAHALTAEVSVLTAIATVGFAGFFVGVDRAVAQTDTFSALLVARAGSFTLLIVALVVIAPRFTRPSAEVFPALLLVGLLDVGANVFFALGTSTGLLSIVAVLASLYPVTTVVLARALLAERLSHGQKLGVALALAGVVALATG